ncbi:MAG: DUF1028 domain-containing protein [Actinomycetota bacterium]
MTQPGLYGFTADMTFSIVAKDGEFFGVAVASKFLAAAALVPACRAGAGALATQANANLSYGPSGLLLLADGLSASDVIAKLTAADEQRAHRQLGVVDSNGNAATYTGDECMDWAGGRTGSGYTTQGNILAGPHVLDAMCEAFEAGNGTLDRRLLAALTAGDQAGGDRRGRQAAGVIVVAPNAGYGGTTDVVVDLRVDDHESPCTELARLIELHHLYFDKPTEQDLVPVDAHEIQRLLRALGYEVGEAGTYDARTRKSLEQFAGWENLEERLIDGNRIDRHILEALRTRTATVAQP